MKEYGSNLRGLNLQNAFCLHARPADRPTEQLALLFSLTRAPRVLLTSSQDKTSQISWIQTSDKREQVPVPILIFFFLDVDEFCSTLLSLELTHFKKIPLFAITIYNLVNLYCILSAFKVCLNNGVEDR